MARFPRTSQLPRVLICAFAVLALSGVAQADDWGDARKDFRRALKSEDWKARASAYGELAYFDGAKAVQEMLKGLARETNPAVQLSAVQAMQAFVTEGARAEFADQLKKARGERQLLLMLILERQTGNEGLSTLMALAQQEKDAIVRCQAGLVLAQRQVKAALPSFYLMLKDAEWQVRSAGARCLLLLAGPVPPPVLDQKVKAKPWLPDWYPRVDVLTALVDALSIATGSDRRAMIAALERIGKVKLGYDVDAWRSLIAGTAIEKITRNPTHVPYFFGLPVFGKRVAILMTVNHRMSEPHPYTDRKRLQALTNVPGARSIPWMRMKSNGHFMTLHVARTVRDLESGTKFNIWFTRRKVERMFGSTWVAASRSSALKVEAALADLKTDPGDDPLTSFLAALDAGGKKDGAAWAKGPDEVLYVSCTVPWLADVTDQQVIGSTVGLKARRRMVPIVAVGVHEHAYEVMEQITGLTGGVYVSLER